MIALDVEGMSCMGCVKSVENAVARTDTAATVAVDLESGRVTITSGLPRARFVEAIEAAGYEVRPAA
jgi:copper chaperone